MLDISGAAEIPVSHPSRGAWIEILRPREYLVNILGRTPRGVRGLKFQQSSDSITRTCRTPRGVRGLKLPILDNCSHSGPVAPLAGCVD